MILPLAIMGMIPTEWVFFAQVVYQIAIFFSPLSIVGYYKSVQLSSGPFASTIMSWFTIVYSMIILLLPILKTLLVSDDTPAQWRIFFFMGSGICLLTLIVWLFTVEVELRPWADIQSRSANSKYVNNGDTEKIIGSRESSKSEKKWQNNSVNPVDFP